MKLFPTIGMAMLCALVTPTLLQASTNSFPGVQDTVICTLELSLNAVSDCAAGGSITAIVTNGTAPYNYLWSNNATESSLSNLTTGSYSLVVVDANGCADTASAEIDLTDSLHIEATIMLAVCDLSSGSISAFVTGGTPPYTYNWSSGSTLSAAGGLAAGVYELTVTDANNCSIMGVYTVSSSFTLAILPTVQADTCGLSNGSIIIEMTGGVEPYQYEWNTGDTVPDLTGITTGTFNITVTDSTGCQVTSTFTLNPIPSPISTVTSTGTGCLVDSGSVTVVAAGDALPFTYLWNTGDTVIQVDNLAAGQYIVTVTDTNGCFTIDTAIVVSDQEAPIPTFTVVDADCNQSNGSIVTSVNGGVPPYYFSWSTGDSVAFIDSLATGDYTLTVTDTAGCHSVASATITTNQNLPEFTFAVTNSVCDLFGFVDVVVDSGVAPFMFAWSNGETNMQLDSVLSGVYTVTVTDSLGCFSTDSVSIVNTQNPPTLSDSVVNSICDQSNGSIDLNVDESLPPYTFAWSNGMTTEDLDSLQLGTYTVTVTAANTCSVSQSIEVSCDSINSVPALTNLSTLNIYPNPATDNVTIETKRVDENVSLIIYNALGKVVYRETKLNGNGIMQLNISEWSTGLYSVELRNTHTRNIGHFIKE